jgi:hypothetical protein
LSSSVGAQYNIAIVHNGVDVALMQYFVENNTITVNRPTGVVSAIVRLFPGSTLDIRLYHVLGGNRALSITAALNFLSIQEIPGIIQR